MSHQCRTLQNPALERRWKHWPGRTGDYKCADGGSVTAKYIQGDPPTAKVVAGSTTYHMTLEPAGGGAKYSDGKATWWAKGKALED